MQISIVLTSHDSLLRQVRLFDLNKIRLCICSNLARTRKLSAIIHYRQHTTKVIVFCTSPHISVKIWSQADQVLITNNRRSDNIRSPHTLSEFVLKWFPISLTSLPSRLLRFSDQIDDIANFATATIQLELARWFWCAAAVRDPPIMARYHQPQLLPKLN